MYKQFFPAECKDGHKGDTCRGKITEYQSLKSKIEINIPKVANKIVEYTNEDNTNKDNNKLLSLFTKKTGVLS